MKKVERKDGDNVISILILISLKENVLRKEI